MDDQQMITRIHRMEWEIDGLKREHGKLEDRIVAIRERMDTHHAEVMAALGSLRDDRARSEGAMEERIQASQRTRDRMKMIALVVSIVGGLATLGWIGEARGDAYMGVVLREDHADGSKIGGPGRTPEEPDPIR